MSKHPIDQLLMGWEEDGKPCGYYYDKQGHRYYTSKYSIEEHKWKGWYWLNEKQGFMRWNDMMDYYAGQN